MTIRADRGAAWHRLDTPERRSSIGFEFSQIPTVGGHQSRRQAGALEQSLRLADCRSPGPRGGSTNGWACVATFFAWSTGGGATAVDLHRDLCQNGLMRRVKPIQHKLHMKTVQTAAAAMVALSAWLNISLLAADTTATIAPDHPAIVGQATKATLAHGWYGPGYDARTGYFNPALSSQYNPYPYYNIVGGESFAPLFQEALPDQNESPLNPPAALSRHVVSGTRLNDHRSGLSLTKKAAQAVPPRSSADVHSAPLPGAGEFAGAGLSPKGCFLHPEVKFSDWAAKRISCAVVLKLSF